ncbi:MAG: hypothetical protein AAB288_09215 [Acidobacteriota bacterium]
MKYKLTLITVLIFSATFAGCGGATEKKETETKTPAASSNTNSPTTAQPAGTPKDADDIRSTPSNTANSNGTKSGDTDDKRSVSNARNSNRPLKRGDADDRGKRDSDGDNDDR